MLPKLFLIIAIFLISTCIQASPEISPFQITKEMEWLYSADPLNDFQVAIEKQDYRFIGLYGVTLLVPKIPKECISMDNDVKFIEGTSDVSLDYEHQKLTAIASVYAENYNFIMYFHRVEKMGFKCDL